MIQEQFQKWIPIDNLGSAYDVENITWGDGISFTLAADKKRIAQDNVYCFQLTWDSSHIISYNITDETYRADCWDLDFENNGRFYTSKNSDYIENFKKRRNNYDYIAGHQSGGEKNGRGYRRYRFH